MIRNDFHNATIGTSINYTFYQRSSELADFYKLYDTLNFGIAYLQYTFLIQENLRLGAKYALYSEDGDGTDYFGLVIIKSFQTKNQ